MTFFTAEALMGRWILDPDDRESLKEYGRTTLEFTGDGRLVYTILGKEKDQKILLTYQVENNVLFTDQPSHPKRERTPFWFTPDGKLVLVHTDHESVYIRAKPIFSNHSDVNAALR